MGKTEITLPVLIAGMSTKVDGSVKIVLETQELAPQQAGELYGLRNQEAWVAIAPNPVSVSAPEEKADPLLHDKTPSQRLRNVIYVYWKQIGSKADFDTFYKANLEKLIDTYKERLQ